MGVKITGSLPDFTKAAVEVQALAAAVVAKSAYDMEAAMKLRAPVRTGNLKNSISTDITDAGMTAEIGPTASYAPYVNYGTSRQAPQPFVDEAIEEVGPQFEAALNAVAAKALD